MEGTCLVTRLCLFNTLLQFVCQRERHKRRKTLCVFIKDGFPDGFWLCATTNILSLVTNKVWTWQINKALLWIALWPAKHQHQSNPVSLLVAANGRTTNPPNSARTLVMSLESCWQLHLSEWIEVNILMLERPDKKLLQLTELVWMGSHSHFWKPTRVFHLNVSNISQNC